MRIVPYHKRGRGFGAYVSTILRAIVVSMQRNEPCCCNNNPIAGTHSLTWSSASPYQKRLPPPSFEAAAVRDEAVEKATMVKEFSKVENDL